MSLRVFYSKKMLSVLYLIVFLFVHHIESKDMMRRRTKKIDKSRDPKLLEGIRSIESILKDVILPEACDDTCARAILTDSKNKVKRNEITFFTIMDEASNNFTGPKFLRMVFTVLSQTVYYVLNRLIPDIRSFITDKWIELRKEDVNIIPSLPGGALALKRTTILEELENYGITKMDPIISDFCHIIPEVGVNLGIQGTLPFDEWCKVGVVELMRESIRTVGVLIRDRITRHLVDTNPIAAQFVQKILTEPIGNIVDKVKEGHDALVNNIVQKKDSLMTNIASVVKNAIYTSGVNTGTFREFTKQIDFTVEATCEVGDVICDADKVVMIVSALADKRLIWESIVNRLDDPILTVFRGLNGLIHKVEKDVERRTASLSSRNRGEENSGGGNVIGPGGLNAGLSLT